MTAPTVAPVNEATTESGRVAHIAVSRDPHKTGVAVVTEARIYGTPVEALCGVVFVPSRDPRSLPLCEACKQIREATGKSVEELRSA